MSIKKIKFKGLIQNRLLSTISGPEQDDKWIHRICSRTAYIVYNPKTKTLITFSPGNPPSAE